MRSLMINKFLYPNGGSETYIFKLGEALEQHGHQVQYFGMEHEGRCVGNRVNAYTSDMDFHGGSKLSKLTYPIKTIYSKEANIVVAFIAMVGCMSIDVLAQWILRPFRKAALKMLGDIINISQKIFICY